MNLLYYNESFGNSDGSSQHAFGLVRGFHNHKKIIQTKILPALVREHQHQYFRICLRSGFSVTEQCLRFAKRSIQSVFSCRKLINKIDNFKPTILLARASPFDSSPLLISNKLKIPLIAEWNTPFFYEVGNLRKGSLILLLKKWERTFLQSSDMVYTVSNQLKDMLVNQYDLSENKFFTIPNGFDSDIYPKNELSLQEQYEKVRKKSGWQEKTLIAFIGSLKIWHGIENLIKIAEYFSIHDHTIQFLVIGDGEDRNSLKKARKNLKNITWMGFLPSPLMAEWLTGCDLGIMPYRRIDKFYFSPLKLYDMIGACLPSIGSATGQIAEVYKEFPEVGWGVKNGSIEEYIELIKYLQRNKREIMMKRDRLLISRLNHTWKVRVNHLINFIEPISNS